MTNEPEFSNADVIEAIKDFLEFGEDSYDCCQRGYFSGDGYAARCLRYHLEQLQRED